MRQSKKTSQRKTRAELNAEGRERQRERKHRGHEAGSRNSSATQKQSHSSSSAGKDPRIGSKKPIDLTSTAVVPSKKVTKSANQPLKEKLSPEKELELLENDDRLDVLLERLEQNQQLTQEEQDYVDTTLDRIDELMVQLGIEFESDDDELPQPKQADIMHLLKQKE